LAGSFAAGLSAWFMMMGGVNDVAEMRLPPSSSAKFAALSD
jgi:hypothetical protein